MVKQTDSFVKPNHECFWCGWYAWSHRKDGGFMCDICYPIGGAPMSHEQFIQHVLANRCPEAPVEQLNPIRRVVNGRAEVIFFLTSVEPE